MRRGREACPLLYRLSGKKGFSIPIYAGTAKSPCNGVTAFIQNLHILDGCLHP
jgi:hypothetical protein